MQNIIATWVIFVNTWNNLSSDNVKQLGSDSITYLGTKTGEGKTKFHKKGTWSVVGFNEIHETEE